MPCPLSRLLADQLGVTGLIVPSEYGGSGQTEGELGIAMEEMGRVLLCAPFLSTRCSHLWRSSQRTATYATFDGKDWLIAANADAVFARLRVRPWGRPEFAID